MFYSVSTAGVARKENKYFIAKRKPGNSLGEVWEFPGGKAEKWESPETALAREFLEEFKIDIEVSSFLCSGLFTNNGRIYRLIAFRIELLSEEIVLSDHSETAWVSEETLKELAFPKSDMIIVNHLLKKGYGQSQKYF